MTSIANSESRPVPASTPLAGWRSLPPEYAIPQVAPSLEEARAYCKRLASTHYENFSVASLLLTTEALVTDLPEEKGPAAPPMPHGDF